MEKQYVSLMINSTFYDMLGEYLLFIKEVFPELKSICEMHNIELEYRDVAFSVPQTEYNKGIIIQDLRFIDSDRTFFICFRGQNIGWYPNHNDVDSVTINEFPELVDYIGNVSITELAILHALKPFKKFYNGFPIPLSPTKHSLFYFRKSDYLSEVSPEDKALYVNKSNGRDKKVMDFEIAIAKDIIFDIKREFENNDDCEHSIKIRDYEAHWEDTLSPQEILMEYIEEYEKLKNMDLTYFKEIHLKYLGNKNAKGRLNHFTYENNDLKDVLINDILEALKKEFPKNFKN